jgi:AcrR family transcriptional regulator
MDPERRREQLLGVAGDYIGEHGIDVSLDDIARVAGISPPLMRHYFKNRDGLITALAERAARDFEGIYLGPDGGALGERLGRYLDWVADRQWAHRLWVNAANGDVAAPDFAPTRRRMMEAAVATPWSEQDDAMRVRANAWVAVVESTVTRWLSDGTPGRDELVAILLGLATRLGVADGPPPASSRSASLRFVRRGASR